MGRYVLRVTSICYHAPLHAGNGEVRQRRTGGAAAAASDVQEDIDTVLRHHHQVQDKLADEMVHLARNLKDSARLAGSIVKDDTKVRTTVMSGVVMTFNAANRRKRCSSKI